MNEQNSIISALQHALKLNIPTPKWWLGCQRSHNVNVTIKDATSIEFICFTCLRKTLFRQGDPAIDINLKDVVDFNPNSLEITLDNNVKVEFDSGAIRSEIKPFYAAIPYQSLRRVALRATGAPAGQVLEDKETGFSYEGGSRKYGYGNWGKGLPLEDTFNHVIDHLYHWKSQIEKGDIPKDDDLAAAAWGILLPLMTFEQMYVAQMKIRTELMRNQSLTPEEIDAQMKKTCLSLPYLLQPLRKEQ